VAEREFLGDFGGALVVAEKGLFRFRMERFQDWMALRWMMAMVGEEGFGGVKNVSTG